ncbi:MAG: folate family ECF transporter S component [Clostridia bacterium]|nr:folate family ECF transporter S component [Clostridia bacterium]
MSKNREQQEKQTQRTLANDLAVFGNLRVLCFAAMLAAMSVIIAYFAKILFGPGPLRVTFENLPIIFGGVSFGPFVGAMIAAVADLCSCLLSGQAPNPLILVGAVSIGLTAGFLGGYVFRGRRYLSALFIEAITHFVGSMLLKTLALRIYFGFGWVVLAFRFPVYALVIMAESYLLYLLLRSKQLHTLTERIRAK